MTSTDEREKFEKWCYAEVTEIEDRVLSGEYSASMGHTKMRQVLQAALQAPIATDATQLLDLGKITAGANVIAAAYNLVEIVDGHRGAGDKWTNGRGLRLKDTNEWCELYSAVRSFQDRGQVALAAPEVKDGLS